MAAISQHTQACRHAAPTFPHPASRGESVNDVCCVHVSVAVSPGTVGERRRFGKGGGGLTVRDASAQGRAVAQCCWSVEHCLAAPAAMFVRKESQVLG